MMIYRLPVLLALLDLGSAEVTLADNYRLGDGCVREENGETQSEHCVANEMSARVAVRCCSGSMAENTLSCVSTGCVITNSFVEASAHCDSLGSRLCSIAELETDVCCGTGCGFDAGLVWSSDECAPLPPLSITLNGHEELLPLSTQISYNAGQDEYLKRPLVTSEDGKTVTLEGNMHRVLPLPVPLTVSSSTVMDIDFTLDEMEEVQVICFEDDLSFSSGDRCFVFTGTDV
jgi:hypothetical protein